MQSKIISAPSSTDGNDPHTIASSAYRSFLSDHPTYNEDTSYKSDLIVCIQKMLKDGTHHRFIEDYFCRQYLIYRHNLKVTVALDQISPPRPIPSLSDLPHATVDERVLLQQVVELKLNGGIGTSMGMTKGPKTDIALANGMTGLNLLVMQLQNLEKNHGVHVPLFFLLSYFTQTETDEAMHLIPKPYLYEYGLAHRNPRIQTDTSLPYNNPNDPGGQSDYAPPGHGDLYAVLAEKIDLLNKWIDEGKRYLFVSNGDNSGAVVDPSLIHYIQDKQFF